MNEKVEKLGMLGKLEELGKMRGLNLKKKRAQGIFVEKREVQDASVEW